MSPDDGPSGKPSPLLEPGWRHVGWDFAAMPAAEWDELCRQRAAFCARMPVASVLKLFEAGADEPSLGYELNFHRHGLQSATLLLHAGADEETIVVGLLHDIGYCLAPDNHGPVAAAILGPYIGEAQRWMLEHHQAFGDHHIPHLPAEARDRRERWRGHPHFEWTARFIAEFDLPAMQAARPILPLETFVPMVHRLFAKPPRPMELP